MSPPPSIWYGVGPQCSSCTSKFRTMIDLVPQFLLTLDYNLRLLLRWSKTFGRRIRRNVFQKSPKRKASQPFTPFSGITYKSHLYSCLNLFGEKLSWTRGLCLFSADTYHIVYLKKSFLGHFRASPTSQIRASCDSALCKRYRPVAHNRG